MGLPRLNHVRTLTPAAALAPTVARAFVLPPLTPSEAQVLHWVVEGGSNKEIAARLRKAEPTVKHQVSSLLEKSRLTSRSKLIAAVWRERCRSGDGQ